MKNLKTQLAVLLLSALCLLTGAYAQITPLGDSYTNTAASSTNYGAKTLLDVESASQTTYIQFDLSSIPAGYTSSNLAKASLKLYVNAVTTAGSFNVDFINGTWSETTITANNAPALGTTIAASVPLAKAQAHDYILIDVTSAVGAWLNGSQANDGIALVANSPFSASFDSKESTTHSHPPELDVVFTGSGGGTITGVLTPAGSGLTGGGTTGTLALSLLSTCSSNQVLQWNGTKWACATISGGGGTVTSVALAAPASDFKVTGSPITTAGTLSLGWTVAPTAANTANAIVKRDGLGNFAANTVTANSVMGSTVTATTVNAVDVQASDAVIVNTTNFNAVVGFSSSTNATAVSALATATSGPATGVEGQTNSNDPAAKGVLGVYNDTNGAGQGVNGVSLSSFGVGVLGQSGSGLSNSGLGLIGSTPVGVMGDVSLEGIAVLATTDNGIAVQAYNSSQHPTLYLLNSGSGDLLFALGSGGFVSIQNNGSVHATGGFVTGIGPQSRIDHPLDPTGKYLTHASIESSEMLNLYSGNAILGADGSAAVPLPVWFTALNDDFRYQLTPIGGFAQLYIAEEITGNQFRIAGGRAGMKVSWQVTGVRHDAYAKMHPLAVESDKQGEERGHYLHPDAFGQPLEMGITAVQRAKLHTQHAAKPAPVILKGPGVTKPVAR
jgi:hypothetical protein